MLNRIVLITYHASSGLKKNRNKTYCRLIVSRRLLHMRSTFSKSVIISIAVSEMGITKLICRPWNESGRAVGLLSRCLTSQQMLPAIKLAASDTFVFQQDNAASHRAKDTIKLLQQERPDFNGPDLWPPNSPDLNPWIIRFGCYAAETVWMWPSYEQCPWAEATPRWSLEQSAAECYWRSHQRMENAPESVCPCRWTTFWTFIVSDVTGKSNGQIKYK